MIDDRGRDIEHLPSGELGPEIQVCIFMDQEKILIEKADLVEHFSPVKRCARASTEDVFLPGICEVFFTLASFKTPERCGISIAGAIYQVRSKGDHFGSTNTDRGIPFNCRQKVCYTILFDFYVVIKKHYII